MCGIAGYISGRAGDEGLLRRMVGALRHRGPDGQGVWLGRRGDWHVALGHARLSIIDVQGGAQPMADTTGRHRITYNGELYEFAALRRELESRGRSFHTRSDTEVILNALADAGEAPERALAGFDGFFGFAHWDQHEGRLLLARDRMGIKPLYWTRLSDGGIAFASELTPLLRMPGVARELDGEALASYLFLDYVMPPRSMIRGVFKLAPGQWLEWRDGEVRGPNAYWSAGGVGLEAGARASDESDEDRARRVGELVERAVGSSLVSDVPVGCFLSGGVDSSFVAAAAARASGQRLKTFTLKVEDPEFDQSEAARLVSRHIGSEHVEEPLSPATLMRSVDAALDCLDEPLADPSLIPTYLLSKVAAGHVKVVLGGDGADELFGGYPTLRAHAMAGWYAALPRALRAGVVEPLVGRLPVRHGYHSFEWKAKRFVLRWRDDAAERHLNWMSSVDLDGLREAMPGVDSSRLVPGIIGAAAAGGSSDDLLNAIMRLDLVTYMPGSVLTKVDRASMAHGLEVRPPLLSNALVEAALAMPSAAKARGKRDKIVFRRAAAALVPPATAGLAKKGFAIPLAAWLCGPLRERLEAALASSGPVWDSGLLDRACFQRWGAEHAARRVDRSRPLWALIVLDHWSRGLEKVVAEASTAEAVVVVGAARAAGGRAGLEAGSARTRGADGPRG